MSNKVLRAHIKIRVDWEERTLFIFASTDRWGINTPEGSESTFRWTTLDASISWIKSSPGDFDFKAFPDDIAAIEEEGDVCALVLGRLRDAVLFGYLGIESFWGGISTIEEVTRTLDKIASLGEEVRTGSPNQD